MKYLGCTFVVGKLGKVEVHCAKELTINEKNFCKVMGMPPTCYAHQRQTKAYELAQDIKREMSKTSKDEGYGSMKDYEGL